MIHISILAMVSALSFQSERLEIASRVAGDGLPNCKSYQLDGTIGPCFPTFAIRGSGGINAQSLAGKIAFTPAAVARLNDNEFALLAGHEIAHYYLGHKNNTMKNELAADTLGAELACRAGYDPVLGATLFRHFGRGKVHPDRGVRRAAVQSIGCVMQPYSSVEL